MHRPANRPPRPSLRSAARRALLVVPFLFAGSSVLAQPASSFPNKPIRIVVPYAAGAINDTLARTVADKLTIGLGQPVVVENKPGGGATIGTRTVASAEPDGYTLLQVSAVHANNATLVPDLPYDSMKGFEFITLAFRAPVLLVANNAVAANSMQELLALARSKPGGLTYGSTGNGGSAHLMGELLKQMTGIDVLHVPYKGAAPAMTDLMGDRIDFTFASYTAASPALETGRARAFASTGAQRLEVLPNVPTVAEGGVPGYDAVGWWGFAAPAGTPPEVVARLNREINKVLESPDLRSSMRSQGVEVIGTTPEEFSSFVQSEIDKWGAVIKKIDLKAG